ncbi:MAG: hypothetical protein AAF530_19650 [Pseudomonadota bacterium]
MFDLERFVEDCKAAVAEDPTHKAAREVVARAVDDPAGVLNGLGEPSRATVERLYVSDSLTVLNVIWGPMMTLMPHNHEMWAVIGMYTGREDNIYWRRLKDDPQGRIEAAGAQAMQVKDASPLGPDIIHSVTNPIDKLTGAIHVYGGNFFEVHRSEWDPLELTEGDYNMEKNLALFEASNARLAG